MWQPEPRPWERSRTGPATARGRSPPAPACSPSPSSSRSSWPPTGPSCRLPECRRPYRPTLWGGASTPARCWRCSSCCRRGISRAGRPDALSGENPARRHRPEGEAQGHLDLADGLLDDQRTVAGIEAVHLVRLVQPLQLTEVVVDLPDRAARVVGA